MDGSQAIPGAPGAPGFGGRGAGSAAPSVADVAGDEELDPPAAAGAAERVARLRGAGVDVDRHRLVQVVIVVLLAALVGTSIGLFVVGAHRNDQIDTLRNDGRVIGARVTGCSGLLGGSGSNAAGFTCRAAYVVHGTRHVEVVPGDVVRSPGSRVAIVVAASDPTLIDTPSALAREHASWYVFILPSVLALVFFGGLAFVVPWWRKGRPASTRKEQSVVASDH